MFSILDYGITGRALKEALLTLKYWTPRDYTPRKSRSIDDRPYGGGPGMIMMAQPLQEAIQAAKDAAPRPPKVVYLSPQGKRFGQQSIPTLLAAECVILVAGRYEGIDERLITLEIEEEWSIGDFILSGGELAAMTIIDATARLIPGTLGHEDSAALDTFSTGLLKYPQYTRPKNYQGLTVPEVLLSGDHKKIDRWRMQQSLGNTWLKRPDLLTKVSLDQNQLELLMEFIQEQQRPL